MPHIVNNAYGRSRKTMRMIDEADRSGRVDAFVQSTDKNLMVPVGGAFVASSSRDMIDAQPHLPGRASASPVLDAFMTLLSLGRRGFAQLMDEREEMMRYLAEQLGQLAARHGERLLQTPHNPISLAMTLSQIEPAADASQLGTMLFARCVSGARVVVPGTPGGGGRPLRPRTAATQTPSVPLSERYAPARLLSPVRVPAR